MEYVNTPHSEQSPSPPSEAWGLGEEKRQSKVAKLRDCYREALSALEHIGEAQSSINFVDPKRKWVSADEIAFLWELRARVMQVRQDIRDRIEILGGEMEED